MTSSVVSEKGWVVIPHEIRKRYGLKKGDRVHVVDYGGIISIVPTSKDPVKELRGLFKGSPSLTNALLASRREDALNDK
jgi:AbrB family looped-hinge helix DNA binding protein